MSNNTNKKRKFNKNAKTNAKASKFQETKERKCEDFHASTPNDWRWYAANPQLLKDTASIPFTQALGVRNNLGELTKVWNARSIPGVMAIRIAPTFGYSDNANSPINVAARNVYSYVRHANSGSANYDSVDLMLYLCAMDSMYSFHEHLKRIYGVIQTYSYENRYYPRAIAAALGVDFDDIQRHLADFRAFVNAYAVKIGSMCVPASMAYMAKHSWMFRGLYLDSNTTKAQTYAFVPDCFYAYGYDDDGAGCLRSIAYLGAGSDPNGLAPVNKPGGELYTFEKLVDLANALLDPVLMSEDMGIMSGDILKAFGSEGVIKVDGITEEYTVLPSYDDTVLDIIQNTTLCGNANVCILEPGFPRPVNEIGDGVLCLYQSPDKDYLLSTPAFVHHIQFRMSAATDPGLTSLMADRIVNFEHTNVGPEMVMEATRMCNVASKYDDELGNVYYDTIGSEVATYAIMYEYADMDGEWVLSYRPFLYYSMPFFPKGLVFNVADGDGSTIVDAMKSLGAYMSYQYATLLDLSTFNRHPGVAPAVGIEFDITDTAGHAASQTYEPFNGVFTDYNYYARVDRADLKVMSEVALLSQFNVRQYGRTQV